MSIEYRSETGLLGYLGYRVGASGKPAKERQHILLSVYKLATTSPELRRQVQNWKEWGEPESRERLQKMVTTISQFIAGRDPTRYAAAIEDWTEDLRFLRHRFENKAGISWPPLG